MLGFPQTLFAAFRCSRICRYVGALRAGQLVHGKRDLFNSTKLAKLVRRSGVGDVLGEEKTALQIRKCERFLTVAAVRGSYKVEERLILGYRKYRPLQNAQPAGAKLPANIRISPTYGCPIIIP